MAKTTTKPPPPPPAEADPQASYTVLARRYRPQQFTDVVGQEAVTRALLNALKNNRVAHAYLFTGARGVGKTSTARILAKALNCVNGPTATPCGVCDACRGIASGDDVDVLEIDGASNRGIDEVREIRQNVQYRPGRGRYKIYIIDEVHMLTTQAFNALLKTLEEPPPHVKFIFATTEVQRIPVTILSRCQRFDFAGIATTRIVDCLREVVAAEGLKADDDALELVARRAGGSLRDAQSLLDQLLAFGGERLTSEQVHQLLGTAHDDRVADLAGAVLARDAAKALELLADAAGSGLQLGELVDQLVDYWRDLMVTHCTGAGARDLGVPPRHREALTKRAESLSLDTILAGLDVLATTKARLRGSNHGRVLIEMALVRLSRLEDLLSLGQLTEMLAGGAVPSGKPAPRIEAAPRNESKSAPPIARPATATRPSAPVSTTTPLTADTLERVWADLLTQASQMTRGHLEKAAIPAISGPNTLVLRFPPTYNSSREYCQNAKQVEYMEGMLRALTGQSWSLRVESAADPTAAPTAMTEGEHSQSRGRRQEYEELKEQHPLVRRAAELLGAVPLNPVEPGFGGPARAQATENDVTEEA